MLPNTTMKPITMNMRGLPFARGKETQRRKTHPPFRQRSSGTKVPMLSQQPLAGGKDGGFGAVRQAQLAEDLLDVKLDGMDAQEEVAGDLGIGHAARDTTEDVALALGERGGGPGLPCV